MTQKQKLSMGSLMTIASMILMKTGGYKYDPSATYFFSYDHNHDPGLIWLVILPITIILGLIFFFSAYFTKNKT